MFGQFLKSRLLLPIYIVLIGVAVLQAMLFIGAGSGHITDLRDAVNSQLNHSQSNIKAKLSSATEDVGQVIDQMTLKASSQLKQDLSSQLEAEGTQVSADMNEYLLQSATIATEIMAQIAPPLYWDEDIPELSRLAQMTTQLPNIIFAVYLNKDEKPMTRYLDRKDAKVKSLLSASKVRGSMNKVIDAARKDGGLILVSRNVESQGVTLGRFMVGISKASLDLKVEQLNQRFDVLIANAGESVSAIINKESALVNDALKQTNDEVLSTTETGLQKANRQMEDSSGELSMALLVQVIMTSVLLFLVVAYALGTKVLLKVNVLRKAIWNIAEGDGDLTQRANVSGNDEIKDMATGLNRFIENTQGVVRSVNDSAHSAVNQTSEMARASVTAHESVDAQRLELDQVSSAMSEMSETAQQVTGSIQTATEQIEMINQDAGKTASVAGDVRSKLNDLVERINRASEVVDQLNDHTVEIGSVLVVIQGIAEQTNLLALNAAIEAARAGESGRGFAVVADEVRALAGKTQQSTEEIQQTINNLQSGSTQAVKAIQDATGLANESLDAFSQTDALLENVHQAVVSLLELTTQITARSSEQTAVAGEIEKNIINIHSAAEKTTNQVDQAANVNNELESTVADLQDRVSRFKV